MNEHTEAYFILPDGDTWETLNIGVPGSKMPVTGVNAQRVLDIQSLVLEYKGRIDEQKDKLVAAHTMVRHLEVSLHKEKVYHNAARARVEQLERLLRAALDENPSWYSEATKEAEALLSGEATNE